MTEVSNICRANEWIGFYMIVTSIMKVNCKLTTCLLELSRIKDNIVESNTISDTLPKLHHSYFHSLFLFLLSNPYAANLLAGNLLSFLLSTPLNCLWSFFSLVFDIISLFELFWWRNFLLNVILEWSLLCNKYFDESLFLFFDMKLFVWFGFKYFSLFLSIFPSILLSLWFLKI